MGRYAGTQKFSNDLDYYEYLRKNRGLKRARHYATPRLKHPTVFERSQIAADSHIWRLGDRYYKLADQYYGDSEFWWVIAWYNAIPIEADIKTGDMIQIPVNLSAVLSVLDVSY